MLRRTLAALCVLWPVASHAQNVEITGAWARAAPAGRTTALYMTITSNGGIDRLAGISTPVAAASEVHETLTENGIMKMRPAGNLVAAPDHNLVLAPGGYHVMLIGLTRGLQPGDAFPVTVTFEHAGPVQITATVAKPGAAAPP